MGDDSNINFTEDIIGATRVQDCQIDKGAYEFNGAINITPDTYSHTAENQAIYYVTPDGFGMGTASDPYNAACASKLQKVLDAAGRYKYANPSKQVIVKVAADYAKEGLKWVLDEGTLYSASRTTEPGEQDVRLYSIMVPRGVEMWGGYADTYTSEGNDDKNASNGFYSVKNGDNEMTAATFQAANAATRATYTYEEARDVAINKTIFDSYYYNTDSKTNATCYHVITFTDRLYDVDGNPYASGQTPDGATVGNGSAVNGYLSLSDRFEDLTDYATNKDNLYRAVIDGIFVQGGNANIAAVNTRSGDDVVYNIHKYGGAAVVKDYAHVRNCVLQNNSATNGGALALLPGALVSGTLMEGNNATEAGGAIYVFSDGMTVNLMEGQLKVDTKVTDGSDYDSKMAHVYTSTIVGNSAGEGQGGGAWFSADEANVRFNSAVVWRNSATDQDNIYGMYNPNTVATESSTMDANYYTFNYSAVQEVAVAGVKNLTLARLNSAGARFIKNTSDIIDYASRNNTLALTEQPLATQDNDLSDFGFYGLTNYSILCRTGMPVDEYNILTGTLALSDEDFVGTGRTYSSESNSLVRTFIDIGARAFNKIYELPQLMLRIYVAKPDDIDMDVSAALMNLSTESEDAIKYYSQEGSSMGYPMQNLQDALDYIQTVRTPVKADTKLYSEESGENDEYRLTNELANEAPFEIVVAGGTYYTQRDISGKYLRTPTATFAIPEGVSIYGGFGPTRSLDADGKTSIDANGTTTYTVLGRYNELKSAEEIYANMSNAYNETSTRTDNIYNNDFANGRYFVEDNVKAISQTADIVRNGVKITFRELPMETMAAAREQEDVNQNGVVEPWEFKYETVLDGSIDASTGVQHVVSAFNDVDHVGLAPTPTYVTDDMGRYLVKTMTEYTLEQIAAYTEEQLLGMVKTQSPDLDMTQAADMTWTYYNDGYHTKLTGQHINLNGLTITNGKAQGWSNDLSNSIGKFGYCHGGGIMVDGNIQHEYLGFSNNQGEARYWNKDKIHYKHNTVPNSVGYRDIPMNVIRCKLTDNSGGYGGAVSSNGTLSLFMSTLEHNRAIGGTDAGIGYVDVTLGPDGENTIVVEPTVGKTIENSKVNEVSYAGVGGAVYGTKQVSAFNTMFTNNEARAYLDDSKNNTIETIVGNSFRRSNAVTSTALRGAGGAIAMGLNSNFHLVNCDVVNNMANAYPAVFTMNPNRYEEGSMNIYSFNQFLNSIIWGNELNDGVKKQTSFNGNSNADFVKKVKFSTSLICNLGLLRKHTYMDMTKNGTVTTQTTPVDSRSAFTTEGGITNPWTDFSDASMKNAPASIEDFLVTDDMVNHTGSFTGTDFGYTTEDKDKRRYAEVAWFSAYEEGKSLPAVNEYEGYRDMPIIYSMSQTAGMEDYAKYVNKLHIVSQITDFAQTDETVKDGGKDVTVTLGDRIPGTGHYQNSNVIINASNNADDGPNFGNPSLGAGYDNYDESADWSPSRLNQLVDAGSGYMYQSISKTDDGKNYTQAYVTGEKNQRGPSGAKDTDGYYAWGGYPAAKYSGLLKSVRENMPMGEEKYMTDTKGNNLLRISYDPNPTHNATYVDMGVYEYRHVPLNPTTVGDEVDILWVASKQRPDVEATGESWEQPTSDMQRAIETLLASRNGHRKEIRIMDGTYLPSYTIHNHTAFYINTLLLNQSVTLAPNGEKLLYEEGVKSLTIKGGYAFDRYDEYDPEKNVVTLRQNKRTNDESAQWDHLFYIDDPTQRYGKEMGYDNNTVGDEINGNSGGQYRLVDGKLVTAVNTIPIEITGVRLINDQAKEGVEGAVIYYPDAIGKNLKNVTGGGEVESDVYPTVENTSAATTNWTVKGSSTDLNATQNVKKANTLEGEMPKLIIANSSIYGSGSYTGDNTTSAAYIGATGGHVLLYNTVFHSNTGKPLVSRAKTRIVNNTYALNALPLEVKGKEGTETTASGSAIYNTALWRNNPMGGDETATTKIEDYGEQFTLYGFVSATRSGDIFKRNSYTGGYVESNDYTSESSMLKTYNYNTGLSFENSTDLANGPNFEDPQSHDLTATIDVEARSFKIRPSQRLMNKGDNGLYVRDEYDETETVLANRVEKNKNFIYDMAWITTTAPDDKNVTTTAEQNTPYYDAAYQTRIMASNIDVGAYEYQNPLRRVLFVNEQVTASTGESWQEPLRSLQTAIDMAALYHAQHPEEQAFVFSMPNAKATAESIILRDGVSIYGAMTGGVVPGRSINDGEGIDYNTYTDDTYSNVKVKDGLLIEYLDQVDNYANRTPVAALDEDPERPLKTYVKGIRTSSGDLYSPYIVNNDDSKAYADKRLIPHTLIDGFIITEVKDATEPLIQVSPKRVVSWDGTHDTRYGGAGGDAVATIETIKEEEKTEGTFTGYVETKVASGGNKRYTPQPGVVLHNIIVAENSVGTANVAEIDNALIYEALFRDNATTGKTLVLGKNAYAVSITATGVTQGADESVTLHSLDAATKVTREYDLDGDADAVKESKLDMENNKFRNPTHVWYSLTNFDDDDLTKKSLVAGNFTMNSVNKTIEYQHLEISPYLELDVYDVAEEYYRTTYLDGKKRNKGTVAADSLDLVTDGDATTGILSMANPKNFLPMNLRDFVNLRTDFDILGNPRFPMGVTGSNDKLDRGAFETWWIRQTVNTRKEDGFYPHPGSVVYLQNRYAVHPPTTRDDPAKIYTDWNGEVSLSLDVDIRPSVLLMQEGTSLYGNGHHVRVDNIAYERTIGKDGSIVALPFRINYGDQNAIWDVSAYKESLKYKVKAEVGNDRIGTDKMYTYNSGARAQWNNIFEAENSTKWKELTEADKVREAGYGVLIKPQGWGAEEEQRVYRFISKGASVNDLVYEEKENEAQKTVVLTQNDNVTDDGSAQFTHADDMGWNLIGIPYLVSSYRTHEEVNADLGTYAMNVPHNMWIYYDGEDKYFNADAKGSTNENGEWVSVIADGASKSKGGYYSAKSWSAAWADWNQKDPGIVAGTAKKNGTTYTIQTAESTPRLWMGEGIFMQTAVKGESENLTFKRPAIPDGGTTQPLTTGTAAGKATGNSATTRSDAANAEAMAAALRAYYGPNYRLYTGSTMPEVVDAESTLRVWASGRTIHVSGLEGGEQITIIDAAGRVYNMVTAPVGHYQTAVPVAGVYLVKVDETVKKVVVR